MNFDNIYKILSYSFEPAFYREYEKQRALLDNPLYHIRTKEENGRVLGFISYWKLKDFIYIEHFAVDPEIRGRGIGGELLGDILGINALKVLEVEPPDTQTNKRRIKFYERNGLVFNDYEYYQPPYRDGFSDERLYIMSSEKLERDRFLNIVKELYSNVYKRNIDDYGIYN